MLWYSACAVGTALQTDALGLNLWRLLTGIGLGVELVTIDGYLSELVPPRIGGRAFALNQVITYSAVPAVALLSSILVPQTFMGMEGWRLVMVSGATGALAVWVIRLGLPESPRWLATHGRIERANAIVEWLEQRVAREDRGRLEAPVLHPVSLVNGSFGEIWSSKYRTRTIMLLLFHAAQSVGLYGFSSWVPTFLIHQGVELAHSLQYTLIIAFMTPVGPVLAMGFADRFERKFQIVAAAILVGATGLAFSQVRAAPAIVLCGSLVTLGATVISLNFHAYQSELYPTRIRALASALSIRQAAFRASSAAFLSPLHCCTAAYRQRWHWSLAAWASSRSRSACPVPRRVDNRSKSSVETMIMRKRRKDPPPCRPFSRRNPNEGAHHEDDDKVAAIARWQATDHCSRRL